MPISTSDIANALADYRERYPEESELSESARLLSQVGDFSSRRSFPMHATAGAILVRDNAEILLIEHLNCGIILQRVGTCWSARAGLDLPGLVGVQAPHHLRTWFDGEAKPMPVRCSCLLPLAECGLDVVPQPVRAGLEDIPVLTGSGVLDVGAGAVWAGDGPPGFAVAGAHPEPGSGW